MYCLFARHKLRVQEDADETEYSKSLPSTVKYQCLPYQCLLHHVSCTGPGAVVEVEVPEGSTICKRGTKKDEGNARREKEAVGRYTRL
jgi:hypothetical protein